MLKENSETILFTGFTHRDTSLKFIKRLWASQSGNADYSSDEEEEDDGQADELLNQAQQNAQTTN